MLTFVAKYATAAHLALLTVAPLFLFPFCSEGQIAKVLLWLSLLCVTWIVMSPSTMLDERSHDARVRFYEEVVRDPLFWFSLLLIAMAGVRALNGGVGFAYDAETISWAFRKPALDIMPGCVDGTGFLPFATCVALAVLLQGLRHALGKDSVMPFLVSVLVLAGVSAIVAIAAFSYGNTNIASIQKCEYFNSSFMGVAYGLYSILGVATLFNCVEKGNVAAELLTVVSAPATALGLAMFSPPLTLAVFASALLIMVAVSFLLHGRTLAGASSLRCTIAVFVIAFAAVAPFLICDDVTALAARKDAILSLQFLPKGFGETRAALSGIALKVWKSGPWLGSGLGSFPLDIKFMASPQDWTVISPLQKTSLNGLWQLLVERGVVGTLLFASMLGFLVWTFVSRLLAGGNYRRMRGVHCVGLVVMLVLVALAFVDCSFLRTDVLLAGGAALALSAAAFPAHRRANSNSAEE